MFSTAVIANIRTWLQLAIFVSSEYTAVVSTARHVNKCISEGMMQVVAWYLVTPGPKLTKFGK